MKAKVYSFTVDGKRCRTVFTTMLGREIVAFTDKASTEVALYQRTSGGSTRVLSTDEVRMTASPRFITLPLDQTDG